MSVKVEIKNSLTGKVKVDEKKKLKRLCLWILNPKHFNRLRFTAVTDIISSVHCMHIKNR